MSKTGIGASWISVPKYQNIASRSVCLAARKFHFPLRKFSKQQHEMSKNIYSVLGYKKQWVSLTPFTKPKFGVFNAFFQDI